jgi:hypothetical protein
MATNDVGTTIKAIVQTWAHMPAAPLNSDVLSVLWSNSGEVTSFQIGALKLAQSLQTQLGSNISATDITDTLTVSQLIEGDDTTEVKG